MKLSSSFTPKPGRSFPALLLWSALVFSLSLPGLGAFAQDREVAGVADGTVVVSIDGLVYEDASDDSRVILRVEAGDRFEVLMVEEEWVQIQLPRGKGWILRSLVRGLSESPDLSRVDGDSPERVTVVDDFADMRQGPGEAYLGIRRVFRGDSFSVSKRSEDGQWVELRVDGGTAWVRADQVMDTQSVGPDDRDEVMREDVLDADLRAQEPEEDVSVESAAGTEGGLDLQLTVGGSMELVAQRFNSDTPSNLFLQLYEIESTTFGAVVGARAFFNDYVGAALSYGVGLGTPISVSLEEGQPAQGLSNQTHRADASVTGRIPFGNAWVGLTAGFALQQFSIQPLQPDASTPPVFLNNTYTGLRIMAEGRFDFGDFGIFGGGGVVLLGSLGQGDFTSGVQNATEYFRAEGGLSFNLDEDFGLFVRGSFDSYDTQFSGAADRQADISLATNKDTFLQVSSGLLWRPL